MFDDLRRVATRQRQLLGVRRMKAAATRLLSEKGGLGGIAPAVELLARLDTLDDGEIDGFFDFLANELSPDPVRVLSAAHAYAASPGAETLMALTAATEPPRQELLRRLNRIPGGTAAVLRLRRQLHRLLPRHPELAAVEDDLLHLLTSWFNPGFLQMKRVDWNSPAQLLEKIIRHEAVHAIDGWDDLRRRLQPDRRCFAFFHPQLPDEPLIFVEVALLAEMPAAIAPLIDKASTPLTPDRFRVAAFYSISNCEAGLRGVSLGNFLIKTVAQQLQRELPKLRVFCTLSPIPGLATWLLGDPDFSTLPGLKRSAVNALDDARRMLRAACGDDLKALQNPQLHEALDPEAAAALTLIAGTYLAYGASVAGGDPVARFHLDNGARLERLNPLGNRSSKGFKQSFAMMVNYLYDLDAVEANHARFRQGDVVRSRAVAVAR